MDVINIKELAVKSRIGIHAWEQAIEQTLLIDVSIPFNAENCTDELKSTIDYSKVCEIIHQHISTNTFSLIEQVANTTATLLKKTFNLETVTLSVHKPKAIPAAKNISVTIYR